MPQLDLYQPSTVQQWRTRFARAWSALRSRELTGEGETSESGSLVSDPYADRYLRRWSEPQERDRLADEIAEIKADHPIVTAAVEKYIGGALNDLKIIVESAAGGSIEAARAARIIERIEENCGLPDLVQQVGSDTVWFGNCFAQPVINNYNEIVDCLQMPVKGMVRNTNARDEFHEPERAFIQRGPGAGSLSGDGSGQYEIAVFGVGQIIHVRRDCRQGERYGVSKIFAGRRAAKDSKAALDSLLPRRLANQPFRVFNIGGLNGKGVAWNIFTQIKNKLSRLLHIRKGGEISPFDDVFVNNCKVEVLGGDPQQEQIGDIEMLIDALLGLVGVSRQLLGWGTNVNRDVLDEQREELYASQRQLKKLIEKQFIRRLIDLGLSLAGIAPNRVQYRVDCADMYTDSRQERRVDRAIEAFDKGIIGVEDAIPVMASYFGIEDVQAAIERSKAAPPRPQPMPFGQPQQPRLQLAAKNNVLALPSAKDLKDARIKRVMKWRDLEIGVQQDPGDVRHSRPMACGYGHIRNTYGMGADGWSLDCYIGANLDSDKIYKITQLQSDGKTFDEMKFMIGFNHAVEARAAYLHQMPSRFFGGISEASIDELRPRSMAASIS